MRKYIIKIRIPTFTIMLLFVLANLAQGGVEYLPEKDTLIISGYSMKVPCVPQMISRADRLFGWGKVHLDEQTDTCIVSCNLQIGVNDGTSTYFQLGSKNHPLQTLIVKGNVRVYPTWLKKENLKMVWWQVRKLGMVNRLTLGVKGNPAIQAKLLIDSRKGNEHTLTVGGYSGHTSENYGGGLCVYNSVIAPLENDGRIKTVYMGGQDCFELINATIKGVSGWKRLSRGILDRTKFENCGSSAVVGTGQKKANDCEFINCGAGVIGNYHHPLVLYNCVFKGNKTNWKTCDDPIVAVDCEIDSYDKGVYSPKPKAFFVSKRHIVVSVVDEKERPLNKAKVMVRSMEKSVFSKMDVMQAVTGKDGKTPGKNENGALLLSEVFIHLVEVKDAGPERKNYSYLIEAEYEGRTGRIEKVVPTKSWELFTITIPKKESVIK